VWIDFSEIFIDSYIISLQWEKEGMWLGNHMILHHRAYSGLESLEGSRRV